MKTVTFLMLLVGFSCYNKLHAQPYQSLFGQHNTYWIQRWNNLPGTVRDSFYVEKDTLYNGLLYKKIKSMSHEFTGALIREDTVIGKVWYKPVFDHRYYGAGDTSEMLAFDYNLTVGDTFNIKGCVFSSSSDIDSNIVDSVYYSGNIKHIRFKKSTRFNEKFEFIEGVGSNNGISYKHFTGIVCPDYLICSYKDNTVSYKNKFYEGNCDVRFEDVSTQELALATDIQLYPNPASDVLHVLFKDTHKHVQVSITDLQGRIMLQEEYFSVAALQVNTTNLSAGIFYLKVSIDRAEQYYKFIK